LASLLLPPLLTRHRASEETFFPLRFPRGRKGGSFSWEGRRKGQLPKLCRAIFGHTVFSFPPHFCFGEEFSCASAFFFQVAMLGIVPLPFFFGIMELSLAVSIFFPPLSFFLPGNAILMTHVLGMARIFRAGPCFSFRRGDQSDFFFFLSSLPSVGGKPPPFP